MATSQADTRISENVRELEPSATIAVSTLARRMVAEGHDVINLSAGEPDFGTPDFIARAGIAAIEAGHTRYTPVAGLPELRRAVAGYLGRDGADVDTDGVVVTAGAKQAVFNALFVLAGPGDRVLIPAPYWTSYPEMVRLARATPVPVRGPESRDFKVGPAELDDAWDPDTRALLLNSPSNPTGAVYSLEELEAVARWAHDRGVWIISDEIYRRICYREEGAPGLLQLDESLLDRSVIVDGASKAFAMTGWRIGFAYTRPDVAARMTALQSHITSNAATPSQHAALAALTATPEDDGAVRSMIDEFRARRDLVLRGMEAQLPGIGYVRPDGAFYLFFRIDSRFDEGRPDSIALCQWLIRDAGVAIVPGAAFGDGRYARLSFAASRGELEDALGRLARAFDLA